MVGLSELLPVFNTSSSTTREHKHAYDVFISFRGADTRNSFTDHLYNALSDSGFITFLDDEEIETGEQLKPELESAIKSSRAYVIVMSKNYASSTWCLDELVLILKQMRNFNKIVIPIFYRVDPTDVRKQQRSFGEAMEKHKQRMEVETEAEIKVEWGLKIKLWKKALSKVSVLKGKNVRDRRETLLIDEVITDIQCRLGAPLGTVRPLLVGRDNNTDFISSWLADKTCLTADILTIVGKDGLGKTSLAKYVFQLHSCKFLKTSFIESINTTCSEDFNGLINLQKKLLKDISKKSMVQVYNNDVSVYTCKIEEALVRKRVFIVLDDICSLDQLDALLGRNGLHPGSKIIITCKDASITERCALFNSQVQPKHTQVILDGLSATQSLELLCIHAFKTHMPKEGYEKVSEKLVKYCNGHPLALQVLGKSLHKRNVAHWKKRIKWLKKNPHSRIERLLHMSFEPQVSKDYKEWFCEIVCFFCGKC